MVKKPMNSLNVCDIIEDNYKQVVLKSPPVLKKNNVSQFNQAIRA